MLQLENDYFIEADNFGYSLHRLEPVRDDEATLNRLKALGREQKNTVKDAVKGYYGSLQSALDGYAKDCIRRFIRTENPKLEDVKQLLADLKAEIEKVTV